MAEAGRAHLKTFLPTFPFGFGGQAKHAIGVATLVTLGIALYYLGDLAWLRSLVPSPAFAAGQAYHEVLLPLLFAPVVYSAAAFKARGAALVALVISAGILPHASMFSPYPDPYFREGAFAIISLLLGGFIGSEISRREQMWEDQRRLQQYVSETLASHETERLHLAQELHDETAQELVDVAHEIDSLREEATPQVDAGLETLRHHVDDVLEGTRRFIHGLRPPLLDELGIRSSLEWLAQEVQRESGIPVQIQVEGPEIRLADTVELALFRATQETLTNARKHARAARIWVHLQFAGDRVRITTSDDGVGFRYVEQRDFTRQRKFGLTGIGERVRLVGGWARWHTSPGKGTRVVVEVPASPKYDSQPNDAR